MDHIKVCLAVLSIITIVSVIFRKSTIPVTLILVIVGMLLSYVPNLPSVHIDPTIVLDGFLPLLLYAATDSASWRDMKHYGRSIGLMSVGHVLFITILVAVALYNSIPQFTWPMAFILGAVISPPDDVAILSIGEKVRMPARVMAILRGEALFNDATALTIFKFALVALITHQFHPIDSILLFIIVVAFETLYGISLGYLLGQLRLRINEPILQILISVLTPFIAYIPADYVFGSGVISTVATGLFIHQYYWGRFPPDVRLNASSVWSTLEFTLQCILFLLVGLNLNDAIDAISGIQPQQLALYSLTIVGIITIGRFIWVYAIAYIPKFLSASIRKRDPHLPWQYPFIVSWSGMRGGISLAAALAVPSLPLINGINPKDLLVFLVFTSIVATLLIQGLSLPWIIKLIGVQSHGAREKTLEHQSEIKTKLDMCLAVLKWLTAYEDKVKKNTHLADEIKLQLKVHQSVKDHLENQLDNGDAAEPTEASLTLIKDSRLLLKGIIDVEREQLEMCWRSNQITLPIKTRLEKQLDLRSKHIEELA